MELAADYVDGITECEYWVEYNSCTEEEYCGVWAMINGEEWEESCDYMADYFGIPIEDEDDDEDDCYENVDDHWVEVQYEDCMDLAGDYVNGLTGCEYWIDYNMCTEEDYCGVWAEIDGQEWEESCEDMANYFGIPIDEDHDMDCENGNVDDFWYEGPAEDCMDLAGEYVNGLTDCEYFIDYNACTFEEYCGVWAMIDGEEWHESCEDMAEMFGIPLEDEDDDEDDDENCQPFEESFNCYEDLVEYIDGLSYCNVWAELDDCSWEMTSCTASVEIDGQMYDADCEEMIENLMD